MAGGKHVPEGKSEPSNKCTASDLRLKIRMTHKYESGLSCWRDYLHKFGTISTCFRCWKCVTLMLSGSLSRFLTKMFNFISRTVLSLWMLNVSFSYEQCHEGCDPCRLWIDMRWMHRVNVCVEVGKSPTLGLVLAHSFQCIELLHIFQKKPPWQHIEQIIMFVFSMPWLWLYKLSDKNKISLSHNLKKN